MAMFTVLVCPIFIIYSAHAVLNQPHHHEIKRYHLETLSTTITNVISYNNNDSILSETNNNNSEQLISLTTFLIVISILLLCIFLVFLLILYMNNKIKTIKKEDDSLGRKHHHIHPSINPIPIVVEGPRNGNIVVYKNGIGIHHPQNVEMQNIAQPPSAKLVNVNQSKHIHLQNHQSMEFDQHLADIAVGDAIVLDDILDHMQIQSDDNIKINKKGNDNHVYLGVGDHTPGADDDDDYNEHHYTPGGDADNNDNDKTDNVDTDAIKPQNNNK